MMDHAHFKGEIIGSKTSTLDFLANEYQYSPMKLQKLLYYTEKTFFYSFTPSFNPLLQTLCINYAGIKCQSVQY